MTPAETATEPASSAKSWRDIIAQRIRENYTLNALAKETGVSAGVLSRFVRGERNVTVATAEKICQALDLVLVPREDVAEDA
jgi:transcriptional regulator with XRE-family HTH domain